MGTILFLIFFPMIIALILLVAKSDAARGAIVKIVGTAYSSMFYRCGCTVLQIRRRIFLLFITKPSIT